ncbi:MAG: tRNA preQ1(34) S-adenosylmethionine ribosyltransferase-isomerase QueA [Candidatus Amoebophilus sp. 36-38]|nr:MAG: tRNA preQ1(34) S-adenosylmethionine ribosyltransferase-isomerase QueA [Candidatus Amoebophilus sp. 36-38]
MKLSSFKFTLPSKLIASHPVENREESRLMVVHKATGKIEHKTFKDVLDYFGQDDTLVLNDTKIFPAKLYGSKEKTGAQIEVFLLRELESGEHLWDTLVEPARKIRVGNKLYFGDGELVAEVLDNTTSRGRTLKFLFEGTREEFYDIVDQLGLVPLPNQLKRKPEPEDRDRYQTVYAKKIGAVVPPGAGLHFTSHLLKRLELKGVNILPVTLHIGLNILKVIDVEDLTKYKTGSEYFTISDDTVTAVNTALDTKKQVCAVGTSTAKALETSVSVAGRLKPADGWTNKLIFPPYDFKICTSLISNFHLPESMPLVNATAFGGYELIMEAYQVAIKEKYRFFVYGDAMLIL